MNTMSNTLNCSKLGVFNHTAQLNSAEEMYFSNLNETLNITILREMFQNHLLDAPIGNDVIALAAIYIPIFLLGILGNGIILFIIGSRPQLRNITNLFLWNLALTDIAGKSGAME